MCAYIHVRMAEDHSKTMFVAIHTVVIRNKVTPLPRGPHRRLWVIRGHLYMPQALCSTGLEETLGPTNSLTMQTSKYIVSLSLSDYNYKWQGVL